jgi:hypothetical protein
MLLKDLVGVFKAKKALQGQPITYNNCTFVNDSVLINDASITKTQSNC